VGTLLRTATPGAATFGFSSPPKSEGPRLEKPAMLSLMSNAPALYVLRKSPGEPELPQLGPLFPFEKAGKMPEAFHASTVAW
jgi:hypothetical protein